MVFKMLGIEHTWQKYPGMGPKPRQVFITQSRALALTAEDSFTKLMWSLKAAAYSPGYVDLGDSQKRRSDLPERFSELTDKDFPLFITYDLVRIPPSSKHPISPFCEQLCTMLQNDYMQQPRRNFVSYGVFLTSYWDYLPRALTQTLGEEK